MVITRWIPGVLGLTLVVVALRTAPVAAESEPSWSAQFSSTAYISQSELPVAGEDQTAVIQTFAAQAQGWFDGKLSANVAGRFADATRTDREVYEPARLYTAYLKLRVPARHSELRLGRQFLHEGMNWLSFDGLHLSTYLSPRVQLRGWAGAQARARLDYQMSDPGERGAFGARLAVRFSREVDASVGWARLERGEEVRRAPVDGELGWRRAGRANLRLRASYETERSEFERFEALGRWMLRPRGAVLSAQYVDRKPQLDANSVFQLFEEYLHRVQIARETLSRRWSNGYGGEIQALQSFTEEESSGDLGFALLGPRFRVGYARTYGDRATGDRFYGMVSFRPRTWWQLQAGAVSSKYELLASAPSPDERELISSYLRSNFEVNESVRFTAEIQTVDRPETAGDLRLLIGMDLRGSGSFASLYDIEED